MTRTRKCLCCGEKYAYCPTCSRADALEPSWKAEFCGETCMTLWSTLTKYGMELLTKDEAKGIISTLELKPIDVYASCVQRDYAKVMVEEKKPRKTKRRETIVENLQSVEEIVKPTLHEVVKQENE